jgi:hypothetical protein
MASWKQPNKGKTNQATNVSTGQFPTMGTSASRVRAVPAERGTKVAKKGSGKSSALEAATAFHRNNIQERLGAKCHPTATLYQANAASAGETQRNVHTVPSAIGARPFYDRRRYGQGV